MTDAKNDKSFLLSKLNDLVDQPQFIGLESYDSTLQDRLRESFHFFKNEFKRRGLQLTLTKQEVDDFLLSSSMGNIFAYLENPELSKKAPLINMEGIAAIPSQDDLLNDDNSFKELVESNQEYLKKLNPEDKERAKEELKKFVIVLSDTLYDFSLNLISGKSPEQLIDQIVKNLPHWLNKPAVKYLSYLYNASLLIQSRDEQSAKNMVMLKKNVIYFVGSLHLKSLSRILTKLCQEELKGVGRFSN